MSRKFSFIYEKLIESNDDLTGHIAYALYKEKKIAFIKSHKDSHGNADPTEEELTIFHDTSLAHLENYRLQAKELLHNFLQQTLEEQLREIDEIVSEHKRATEENYQKKLTTQLDRIKPPFWAGVIQSLIGSIAFTFFLGFLLIVVTGAVLGINGIFELFKKVSSVIAPIL